MVDLLRLDDRSAPACVVAHRGAVDLVDRLAESGAAWMPRVDVLEADGRLTVRVAVPGYTADDLDITVEMMPEG